ncbi:MAG: AAA family ATPase [Candidatus Marinimicrobia bacterium]|nr:AAA family ATPase [Candidatus Neomarinimicrobiota bacterium]|tara:strand:+ start:2566 stop:3558 length:993 start_codon:yes stop_codon:yes gene_type:complete
MTETQKDLEALEKLAQSRESFFNEINKVVVGQKQILDQLLIALLSSGHSLLVGVPGLAKTLIIKTLADVLDLSFKRIQFTPDLMPSDITGTELIDIDQETGQRSFRFFKGPIFGNIVLADEINRTPPKTQAALLEAMQEHKVTAGGTTYNLDEPFFVLATQNPIEQEGTYPLPEAQLDRFMFNLNIEYPSNEEEITIVRNTTAIKTKSLVPIMTKSEIIIYQDLVRRVPVADNVIEYAVKLTTSTRPTSKNAPDFIKQSVSWGAGPRASQYLILGAKAKAILEGRPTPNIEDIKNLALPILKHRILPSFNAEAEGLKVENIILQLLDIIN